MTVDEQLADVERLREALDAGQQWTATGISDHLGIPQRRLRPALTALRLQGYPAVSSSDDPPIYRKARDRAEIEDFISREMHPRACELLQQEFEMREHAGEHFQTGQSRLIA